MRFFLFFPFLLVCFSLHNVTAQNLLISFKNPDTLFVCGESRFEVTLTNNGTAPANQVRSRLTLPTGVRYVAESVTGATQSNITDLSRPEFSVADIPVGGSAKYFVFLRADCQAGKALNSGFVFTNGISATWGGGGSTQITTSSYKVETGLILITSSTPVSISAQAGQIIRRSITVRNTRQGPVSLINFTDQHLPGLSIQLEGIGGQNIGGTFFNSDITGTAFEGIGDGDALFEFNETLVLTELVTITGCQPVAFPIVSNIRVGWGCDGQICQSDTASLVVNVEPSDLNPDLSFSAFYKVPLDLCAQVPNVQEIQIINKGGGAAQNVLLEILPYNPAGEAINAFTLQWYNGSVWLPLRVEPEPSKIVKFKGCTRDSLYSKVPVTIPSVPAGDTVLVRFQAYNCTDLCTPTIGSFRFNYFYNKVCPPSDFANGSFDFVVDSSVTDMSALVEYDFGGCIANEEVKTLEFTVRTGLLKRDSGYLHVAFQLPWGLFWDTSCKMDLEGKMPVTMDIDTVASPKSTVIKMVYALPFPADSAFGRFCVRNVCQPVSSYPPPVDSVPPNGQPITIYKVDPACRPCVQESFVIAQISEKPDLTEKCGYSACDQFRLILDCGCEKPPTLPGSSFAAYRTNLGLRDDDDNRQADNSSRASVALARLDRFMTGDSMRTVLRVKIPQGGLKTFDYRLFTELWESDKFLKDGDDYSLAVAVLAWVNTNSMQYVDGNVVLKKANGASYRCSSFKEEIASVGHPVAVVQPNIKPPSIIDQGASMFRQFSVNPAKLITGGCLPPGTALEEGDSLIIVGNYKLRLNFVSSRAAFPPVVNFRNTVCGTDRVIAGTYDSLVCKPGPLLQYTGYIENAQFPIYGIRVCTTAAEILPFKYSLRIARPNFFPHEVRPLAKLQTMTHGLPAGLSLPTATLRRLNLQDNVLVIDNQPANPVTVNAGAMRINFAPFFQKPIDEGFNAEVGFTFAANCTFNAISGNTASSVSTRFENTCLRDPQVSTLDSARLAYFAAIPRIEMLMPDSVQNVGTETINVPFELKNTTPFPAVNTWVTVETNGLLEELQILRLPDLTPVPVIGNILQTGNLTAFGAGKFQIRARSSACKNVVIKLRYGWNCTPLTSLLAQTCGAQVQNLELRPRFPELELVPPSLIPPLRLCTPSDYYEFEIYNANEGRAYDVLASVQLPAGFRILPATSQLSYPSGTPYVSLPDPQVVTSNTWQWLPESVSNDLKNNGLPGISQAPQHSMKIRFKVQAECGATANSQPFFNTEAVLPCGIGSNVLRKPGPPILIVGLSPSYTINPVLRATTALVCGANTEITAELTGDGKPEAGDSLYIQLPPGVSFVEGSYSPGVHAPVGPPQRQGSVLKLPLPLEWLAGTLLSFKFKVQYDNPSGCDNKNISLVTRERALANCLSQNCTAFVATGETSLSLSTRNPELILKNQALTQQGSQVNFTATLENIGSVTALKPLVQVYYDQNGNGVVDAGEILAGSFLQTGNMNPGKVLSVAGALTLPQGATLCNLIAVLPATENCACVAKVYPFENRSAVTVNIARCKLETVPVTGDSIAGHFYRWIIPEGIACPSCVNTRYTPDGSVQLGQTVTRILQDSFGSCVTERRYNITFDAIPGILTPDQRVCGGDQVLLEATPGGTYRWDGSGITGATTQSVLIQTPNVNTTLTYRVTVTLQGTCSGIGNVRVRVFKNDTIVLPTLRTCTGVPVQVLDAFTDQPGRYTRVLQNINGCDSVYVRSLQVYPNQTQEFKGICEGDSTQLFGKWVKKAGTVCSGNLQGASGCDSIHCVQVQLLPPPQLPLPPDSIILVRGQTVTLTSRPGLAQYVWTPAYNLSCTDCANPNAMPDTSIIYTVRVEDANKCASKVSYRVVVFPPCFEAISIPNAFTPDGDQVNDFFRMVPKEGFEKVRSLTIYNRWGAKIFTGDGTNPQWDGTVNGQPAPTDVYIWFMTIECRGELKDEKGQVNLIR